jgi:hypothetical protein
LDNGLLAYKRDVFSGNGEDGIAERIFSLLGIQTGVCCEFGAWDGIYHSNTRNLILNGWTGIFIEGDEQKYRGLVANYSSASRVHCIQRYVDSGANHLVAIARDAGISDDMSRLDYLSVDIDGLDYDIFDKLELRPKLICIEVSAGHSPYTKQPLPKEISDNLVGQPLCVFSGIAAKKGYSLVAYTSNAFYLRDDLLQTAGLSPLSDAEAYLEYLRHLSVRGKEWMFLVNLGLVVPYHRHHNPLLSRSALGIPPLRAARLILGAALTQKPRGWLRPGQKAHLRRLLRH